MRSPQTISMGSKNTSLQEGMALVRNLFYLCLLFLLTFWISVLLRHYGLLYSSALNARSLTQTFNLHCVVSSLNKLLSNVPTSFIVSATVNKGRAAGRGVAEVADKFASMSVGGARREMHPPPPMKAGGWRGGPGESFVRRSHEVVQPARSYTRKVAG